MNAEGAKFTTLQKGMMSNYALLAKQSYKAYKADNMSTKQFQSRMKYIKMVVDDTTTLSALQSQEKKLLTEISRLDAIGATAAADKLRTNLGLVNVKKQEMEVSEGVAQLGNEMLGAMGDVGSTIKDIWSKGLLAGAIAAAMLVLTSFMGKIDEIGKKLGASGVKNFSDQIMGAGAEMERLGYNTEDAMNAADVLANQFGVSYDEALDLAPKVGEIAKSLGLSVEEGAKLLGTLTEIGGLTPDQAEDL